MSKIDKSSEVYVEKLKVGIDKAADAVEEFLKNGIDNAMNKFN